LLVQFNLWIKKKEKYNCASCQGKMHRCLMQKNEVEIKAVNLPKMKINKDNWRTAVDAFRDKIDNPNYPAIGALQNYNLCPIPLFTELSIETWNLYNAIGGIGKVNSPQEYYNLQAFYVDGVRIIESAIADIQPYLKESS